ncbi:MAG TPA: trypsin-like peptidase domain-containing protein [Streptosporangiaceae bacterium]|nr:trypsin-like peptidase domain-containing protein [Streptosporangiaceae bacterium]
MHEGDSRDGGAQIGPARPSDPPAPAGRTGAPGWFRAWLTYLAVAALSTLAGAGATRGVQHLTAPGPAATGMARAAAAEKHGALNDEAVYEAVEPGVVDVTANLQYLQETAKGTGFVIDARAGLILTNNHVIDGATSVTVTPVTSGRSYPARIVGYDRADDVAVLQVRGVPRLRAVTIGRSSQVQVGTPVLAIGNEAGQGGSPTVAPGVISGLGHTIVASDQSSGLTETLHGMLQTSADIRPGDSGGPLAGADGRVIGIDTAAGGNTVYSGYAIPIDQAMPIARQIAAGRQGTHVQIGLPAFLGVLLPDSSSTSPQRQAGEELHQTGAMSGSGSGCTSGDTTSAPASIAPAGTGALVDGVLCGTPAAQAGLFAGDVITSAGGHAVTSPRSLTAILSRFRPGSQVALAWVAPGGSLHTAAVTLAAAPAG